MIGGTTWLVWSFVEVIQFLLCKPTSGSALHIENIDAKELCRLRPPKRHFVVAEQAASGKFPLLITFTCKGLAELTMTV